MGIRGHLASLAREAIDPGWTGKDVIAIPWEEPFIDENLRLEKIFREVALALGGQEQAPWSDHAASRRFSARLLDGARPFGGSLLDVEEVQALHRHYGELDRAQLRGRAEQVSVASRFLPHSDEVVERAERTMRLVAEAARANHALMVWVS